MDDARDGTSSFNILEEKLLERRSNQFDLISLDDLGDARDGTSSFKSLEGRLLDRRSNNSGIPTKVLPIIAGASVAAAAYGGKFLIQAWQAYKARPIVARSRRFYEGGFQQAMTRREAALILGVREKAAIEKIKEAHRRVMVANHPDAGGSHYLASKINEAKEILTGTKKGGDTAF